MTTAKEANGTDVVLGSSKSTRWQRREVGWRGTLSLLGTETPEGGNFSALGRDAERWEA